MDHRALTDDSPVPGDRRVASLDYWVARHGPLSPDVAIVLAIDACARASRMTGSELRDAVGSLSPTHIVRNPVGRWQWLPVRGASPAATIGDADIVGRLGALLFYGVTGHALLDPFADAQAIRTRLRSLRPDLTPGIADLTVRALSAGRLGPHTLDAFARDTVQVLGIADQRDRPRARRSMAIGAVVAAFAVVAALAWIRARSSERIESHGLTAGETALVDVTEETAQGFAMMDEHTAAIEEYQQLARWLTPRLDPEDPRLAWNIAHLAWARSLRGDRLTTEQILGIGNGAASRLAATLGNRHPYTRAARLELGVTLSARGATSEAAGLQDQAEKAARALLADASSLLTGVPAPPGVIAHLAPNPPAREGFRQSNDAGFFVPLTSIQRLFSGRDGWRMHVAASGRCRATVVVGNAPHLIAVTTRQDGDKSWSVTIGGTAPPITLDGLSGETARLSLIADGNGTVLVRLAGGKTLPAVVDTTARPPDPPYSLAFSGGADGSGCDLVWLEIPFPFEPKS